MLFPGNLSEEEGIEPASHVSPALQADSLPSEPPGKPRFQMTIFAFLRLTSLGMIISRSICVAASSIISFFFMTDYTSDIYFLTDSVLGTGIGNRKGVLPIVREQDRQTLCTPICKTKT